MGMGQADCVIQSHSHIQVTGNIHAKRGVACQDKVLIRDYPDLQFFGVADGQGGKSQSVVGAWEALHQTAMVIRAASPSIAGKYRFTEQLRCTLFRRIREGIAQMARRRGIPESEYASTLAAIAVEPQTGDYVIAHLGDGCILGIRKDGEIQMMSPPDNGMTRQETWLTTSPHALDHLRLKYGNIRHYCRIILLTDGAESICKGRNLSDWARHNLPRAEQKQILEYLRDSVSIDDASCIVIDIRHPGRLHHKSHLI